MLDNVGRECMGKIYSTQKVDFDCFRPVSRFEIPEWKAVFARTDGCGANGVVDSTKPFLQGFGCVFQ